MKREHIIGFIAGVGAAALGIYLYQNNQDKVHDFLEKQGINLPRLGGSKDSRSMTLEQLVLEKEHLEDIIAEKELELKESKKTTSKK
ncbi:hypothetical protein [Salinispira pacifica]|uniref:Uncharacterized protein n=1 Tax=Salinispira pacifica TaxID=1307761 RepID=V5WG18_9SPIO|nr:hypothetical protein [Salinispira pacifica]AHC14106.1 hypothetical protein L21SP2_0679 [Salinispira pacifica]